MAAAVWAAPVSFTRDDARLAYDTAARFVAECTPRDAGTKEGRRAAEWICSAAKKAGAAANVDRFFALDRGNLLSFANVTAEFPGGPKALERMRKLADRYFDEYWGQDRAFGDEEHVRAEGIELELNGYMAAFVRDWALVKSGRATLSEGKDGKAVLKIGRLAPTNEFVSWLAGHVPEVVVLGPESLRRKVAEKIKLGNGIYSGSAGKGAARPRS